MKRNRPASARHVAMTPVAARRWIGCKHRSVAPCCGRYTIGFAGRRCLTVPTSHPKSKWQSWCKPGHDVEAAPRLNAPRAIYPSEDCAHHAPEKAIARPLRYPVGVTLSSGTSPTVCARNFCNTLAAYMREVLPITRPPGAAAAVALRTNAQRVY
jgi:hypothetical protein